MTSQVRRTFTTKTIAGDGAHSLKTTARSTGGYGSCRSSHDSDSPRGRRPATFYTTGIRFTASLRNFTRNQRARRGVRAPGVAGLAGEGSSRVTASLIAAAATTVIGAKTKRSVAATRSGDKGRNHIRSIYLRSAYVWRTNNVQPPKGCAAQLRFAPSRTRKSLASAIYQKRIDFDKQPRTSQCRPKLGLQLIACGAVGRRSRRTPDRRRHVVKPSRVGGSVSDLCEVLWLCALAGLKNGCNLQR